MAYSNVNGFGNKITWFESGRLYVADREKIGGLLKYETINLEKSPYEQLFHTTPLGFKKIGDAFIILADDLSLYYGCNTSDRRIWRKIAKKAEAGPFDADSQYVYYTAEQSPFNAGGIYRVPITGGDSELLCKNTRLPSLYENGRLLFYIDLTNRRVNYIDLKTKKAYYIASSKSVMQYQLMPGHIIFLAKDGSDSSCSLHILDVNTLKEQYVISNVHGAFNCCENKIYYQKVIKHNIIYCIDVNGNLINEFELKDRIERIEITGSKLFYTEQYYGSELLSIDIL